MTSRCRTCSQFYDTPPARDGRCPACAARGLLAARAPAVSRTPLIIEGEVVAGSVRAPSHRTFAVPREISRMPTLASARAPARRPYRALAACLALALIVGGTVPIAAALPGIAALFSSGSSIVIDRVESTVMIVGGENAIVVTGTLTNPTRGELPVPAVRVALKGGEESDSYARVVEPATLVLAPGASLAFRSTLKKPVSGYARVVVSLVPREQRIGMN